MPLTLEQYASEYLPQRGLPQHCIDHTNGQKKLPFTLLPKRILLHGDNTIDVPYEVFRKYQQVIFTKRDRDFFNNPKADRLINSLDVNHLIVFGVVTEYCVKAAVLGLMTRRQRVVVVTDACGHWSPSEHELAFRQMDAKGAILVTTEELVSGAADERIQNSKRPAPFLDDDVPEELLVAQRSGKSGSNGRNGSNGHHSDSDDHSSTLINPGLLRANLTRKGLRATSAKAPPA